MNSNIKSIISSLVMLSFFAIALACYPTGSQKKKEYPRDKCDPLEEPVTYTPRVTINVIDRKTEESLDEVKIIIYLIFQKGSHEIGENNEVKCVKSSYTSKRYTRWSEANGIIAFDSEPVIFENEVDVLMITAETGSGVNGYKKAVLYRNYLNTSDINITMDVLSPTLL